MHILIISDDFKTGKVTGSNIRLCKLLKYIKNHQFTIFTVDGNCWTDKLFENIKIVYVQNRIYGFVHKWIACKKNIFQKVIWKLLTLPQSTDYLWIHSVFKYIDTDPVKYDLILLQVPSLLNIFYGIMLKQKFKVPLVFDLRDDLINFKHLPGVFFMEKLMVKYADKVVCVTRGGVENLSRKYPVFGNKICFIPNGYDEEDIPQLMRGTVAPSFSKKRLVYAGSIYKSRLLMFDFIFHQLHQLFQMNADFREKLLVIFYTDNKKINSLIHKYHLSCCVQVKSPIISTVDYFRELQTADYLISVNANTPFSIPGKLYEYLAVNSNVIHIDNHGIVNEVLQYFSESYIVNISQQNDLKTVLRNIAVLDKSIEMRPKLPIEFSSLYSRKNIAQNYSNVLNKLIQ